jgi:hypothetical protein
MMRLHRGNTAARYRATINATGPAVPAPGARRTHTIPTRALGSLKTPRPDGRPCRHGDTPTPSTVKKTARQIPHHKVLQIPLRIPLQIRRRGIPAPQRVLTGPRPPPATRGLAGAAARTHERRAGGPPLPGCSTGPYVRPPGRLRPRPARGPAPRGRRRRAQAPAREARPARSGRPGPAAARGPRPAAAGRRGRAYSEYLGRRSRAIPVFMTLFDIHIPADASYLCSNHSASAFS